MREWREVCVERRVVVVLEEGRGGVEGEGERDELREEGREGNELKGREGKGEGRGKDDDAPNVL